MRLSEITLVLIVALGSFAFSGCGNDGNTVIEPSGQEATAEDMADYEAEQLEMEAERD